MRIWDGVEIEFFDAAFDLPDNKELVLVIIKKDWRWKGAQQDIFMCTTFKPKKGPPRFSHENGYKFYRIEDIQCWGRLIRS